MVDGFIALLQGVRRAAEAKGYKGFLELAGIHQLKPGSILQNHEGQTVIGCSAKVSRDINDFIIQAVQKPGASAAIKVTNAAKSGADLRENLTASFEALRDKLRERGIDLARDVKQEQRSNRGEHVFNNALLGLYGSIIDEFIKSHVTGDDRVTLVGRIPNSRVSDAFQGHAPDGDHINLTAAQRRNISTWVVHIPYDVAYVPINNILFAYMTKTIRDSAVDYMNLFRLKKNNVYTQHVLDILRWKIEWINTHRVYLDPLAAERWFSENPNLIPQFHTTETGVQLMLRHLDPQRSSPLRDFVNDLTNAGATFR
ncbi:uncharacterized protein LOC118226783 isoform X2 [Anguilla anguilla]|uniref:uncharacterized protein LOC118226783 isoform X2 n=1 Tax=Anguilla anguilla TaxID=7936 RepID=UPI0015AE53E2|nr:uncharacterized protein LOC118226783 isoform X2 [Anguilla anguilla]